MTSSPLRDAALQYAAMGWHVFPVQRAAVGDPDSGKRPVGHLVPNGKLNATTDPSVIQSWWAQGEWNIGIACEPSNIVVLDVDIGQKKDGTWKKGRESLAAIDDKLDPTRTASTGSGGIHIVYARPPDYQTGSKIGFAEGLDLISNGYVIAAPSNHYSGGYYGWHNQAPITPLPVYLRSVARAGQTAATSIKADAAGVTKIEEGGRNNALFRFGAALYSSSAMAADTLLAALWAENTARFSPPLGETEVRQIVASIIARVQPQRDAALGAVIEQQLKDMFGDNAPATEHKRDEAAVARGVDLVPSIIAQSKLPVVHLPFKQLDDKLNGLSLHSNTLLVAGTGKGKSSLAANISLHHAGSNQGSVHYYVGEMTRELVVARFIGVKLKRSWADVLRGKVPQDEMTRALESLPLYFVKRSENPLMAIIESLKMAAADGAWTPDKVPMIVIDYIQLMASVGADMRISTMQAARELRQFLEDAPVIGLTLSQSSRSGSKQMREGGADAEDLVGVGAETSELEQSCTNEFVLSFKSKDDAVEHDVTLMVAKSRFGGGTKLGFIFNGRTGEWIPTDKPPVDPKHQKRMDEIMVHVSSHAMARCNNGTFCGAKLNKAAFRDKAKVHWVDGNPQQHTQALEDLVELKLIRCENGMYVPANSRAPGVVQS
jgi:hypothetical protein